jgi:hypothetical protein
MNETEYEGMVKMYEPPNCFLFVLLFYLTLPSFP